MLINLNIGVQVMSRLTRATFLCLILCASLAAGATTTVGVPLFDMVKNGISEGDLDESELKQLKMHKADPAFASMKAIIIKFDPSVLDRVNAITVTTPDAKILQFTLGKREITTTLFFDGLKRKEVPLTSWVATPSGSGRDYFNAVYTKGGFSAQFSDMDHVYTINSLGASNRYYILMERISTASGAFGHMTREELEKEVASKKAARSVNREVK